MPEEANAVLLNDTWHAWSFAGDIMREDILRCSDPSALVQADKDLHETQQRLAQRRAEIERRKVALTTVPMVSA